MAALIMVALIGAGCSSRNSGGDDAAGPRAQGVKFAQCMRDNGVTNFPDPDADGELTADGVANNSSVDTSTPTWQKAMDACRDLEPAGFTGHKRTAAQQQSALKFAQCMRDNGIKDFPDPEPDGALIDTNRIPSAAGRGAKEIPGFEAASTKCKDFAAGALDGPK
ncbi:hypothetical protein ACQP2F_45670 [Actinoplanes sp. CA-030573]|uniref:hypothetical protein n=1 Tax=Actinoplanes sp. CA-030573 TaxID=3239898 RepID=UPI003D9338BD